MLVVHSDPDTQLNHSLLATWCSMPVHDPGTPPTGVRQIAASIFTTLTSFPQLPHTLQRPHPFHSLVLHLLSDNSLIYT